MTCCIANVGNDNYPLEAVPKVDVMSSIYKSNTFLLYPEAELSNVRVHQGW